VRCDALVGYAWCRSSYVAIRSLCRLGLRVAAADVTKFGMGQCSRYAAARYVHANPAGEPEKFIEDIAAILDDCGAKFYLPGHDEGEVVAKYRKRLPEDVVVPLPDYSTLALANDKMRTTEAAIELGVPVPGIIRWSNTAELREKIKEAAGPVVIKLRRTSGAKGVFYADDAEQTVSTVNRLIRQFNLRPDRYPVIQEKVNGEGWGVSCLYHQGMRVTSFTHRRLREKVISGGTSTLRESAHNETLEKYAYALLDGLCWHGLAMVEFKWDSQRNQGWLMEINPRLWGSIALAVACGIDFPAMIYFAATRGAEKARRMDRDYEDGIVARWYLGDIILSVNYLARCRPAAALKVLLPGSEDVYDDLIKGDKWATAAEFISYFERFLKYRSTNPLDRGHLG